MRSYSSRSNGKMDSEEIMKQYDRLRNGLYWEGSKRPVPSWYAWVHIAVVILAISLAYVVVSLNDARTGLLQAEAGQVKAEVTLVHLLNGEVLEDKENKLALSASVIVVEEKELLK